MSKRLSAMEEQMSGDIKEENIWIIPYGNLMTILMILFLILYGFSTIKTGLNMENVIQDIREDLKAKVNPLIIEKLLLRQKELVAANKMDTFLNNQGLKQFANVSIDQEGLKIVLRNPVLFKSGKATLNTKTFRLLDTVAEVMLELPNDVIVEGYTDDIPLRAGSRFKSNWELSAERALAVVEYFAQKGVEPKRLSAIGYGEFRPLFPNDSPQHRAFNRRIEINLINI